MLKYLSLVLLTTQSTLHILMLRYVRTRGGDMFMASTAVVMAELTKVVACLLYILYSEGSMKNLLKHLNDNILQQPLDCVKVAVPSLIYVLQNNLLFVAISNLDVATFQVYYQLKILTTAMFSLLILNKKMTKIQWLALFILFLGVSVVQMQSKDSTKDGLGETKDNQRPLLGMFAVGVSCFMSGFAGVYFEKILKGTVQSVWLRNVQLGGLGVVIGLFTMEINNGQAVYNQGFFYGYDTMVWIVILLQSLGGLIVAVVVKYADNILKGFATSFAIIASSLASVYLFSFVLTLQFCVGASMVMISIYMYGKFGENLEPILPKSKYNEKSTNLVSNLRNI